MPEITPERLRHWAWQPLKVTEPPAVTEADRKRNSIDRFVLAALSAKSMKPNPPADRRTLIRRASLDLLGLPPSPEEVETFVKDDSQDAFAKSIDKLLMSPHYGERWGRHWLDVARYSSSFKDACNTFLGILMQPELAVKQAIGLNTRSVQWLIPGLIPIGNLTIIDGDPGQGKSNPSHSLARSPSGMALPGTISRLMGPMSSW